MENWLLMQTFYHGLTNSTCETWMLPLEEHSYHLQSIKPQLLWRKWHPTKVGMKEKLKPAREVEVCTS
jgi:hypothetical protein